ATWGAWTLLQVALYRLAGPPMPLTCHGSESAFLSRGLRPGDVAETVGTPEDTRPSSFACADQKICCGTVNVLSRDVASKGVSSIHRGSVARRQPTQNVVDLDCAGMPYLNMAFGSGMFVYLFEDGSLQGCLLSGFVHAVSTRLFAERMRLAVVLKGFGTARIYAGDAMVESVGGCLQALAPEWAQFAIAKAPTYLGYLMGPNVADE
ncbi:unnamed protein product, partial [Prorocentrum cordatum]